MQSCLAAKNEKLTEEADQKRCAANLIIHGKDEEVGPNDDKKFINDLITDLQIGVINIKHTGRIGNKEGRARPIKLVFNNEDERQKVYSNLKNLKGNASYKGISIKEDYTFNERLLIKEFADQARENNTKEDSNSNNIWRVRGSPKNGLTLKRLTKKTQDTTPLQVKRSKTV